jgi:hypothetical protein
VESANNPLAATLLGIAAHDAVAVYPANTAVPSATTLFGRTFVGTKIFPLDPNNQRVVMFHFGQLFEISLTQAWAASLIGTTAGLTKDAASGFWVLDNSLANKPVTIVGKQDGPPSFKGVVGDTFARVLALIPSGWLM